MPRRKTHQAYLVVVACDGLAGQSTKILRHPYSRYCLLLLSIVNDMFQGTILLAVNPLKAVPSPDLELFMNKPLDPEMPHPNAIAEVGDR